MMGRGRDDGSRARRRGAGETTGRGRDGGSQARRRGHGVRCGHGGCTAGARRGMAWARRGHGVRRGHGGSTAWARRGRGEGVGAGAAGAWARARRGRGAVAGARRHDGIGRGGESERVREKETYQALFTRSLPSARDLAVDKDFFKILKYSLSSARSLSLPSVPWATLGINSFTILCRVSPALTLGKAYFAECHFWTLGKVYFYFFYFPNQIFCGVFLHYIDLHVPF
jgi:hypothetical protein